MRICMLISRYPPDLGGMELQCQRLSQALARRGHQVTVLTEAAGLSQPTETLEDGVRVVRCPGPGNPPWSTLLSGVRMTGYLLKNKDFDLYHAHMLALPALLALGLGKILRKPVLVKAAGAGATGDVGTSQRLWRGRAKIALFKQWARHVVCPSHDTLNEFKALGIPENRLHPIPNAVDTGRFSPASSEQRQQARAALKLPGDRLIAVYAGRWAPGKGVERLLDIWTSKAREPGFSWNLLLLLANKEKETQTRMGQRPSLGDRVHIFHNVKDPAPYYQASDLAVLLSDAEGLSNFLLETMACGVPALTTPAAAVSRQPDHETWSWTTAPSQDVTQDAARRLEQLQTNRAALQAKGSAARQAVQNYSMERIVTAYENLYQRMQTEIPA
jgi:glycosyltransferase involved in cell wall biosynthesis